MSKRYVNVQSNKPAMANDPTAKVSVILPIYNASAYLDQALNSVRQQTHINLEIICINDGSTDNSLEIMRAHAADDPRVVVVDKPNEGYGAGCNRGIQEAHGEWIAIVEPDDWIEPGMYGDMLTFASTFNTRIDMVKTPYWRITDPDTPQQQKLNCPFKKRVKTSKKPFTIDKEPRLLRHHPCIWSAIYRKSFLDEFGIRFKPIPGAGWADNPFLMETVCQARAIVYLDQAYYCYREETIDKTENFHVKQPMVPFERWNDMQDILERLNVTDPGVLGSHVKRGFMYAGGVLEYHSLEEPEINEAVKHMFGRMDPALAFAEVDVSPAQKRLFAEVRGIECPKISEAGYKAHVVGRGVYSLVNAGPKATVDSVTRYLRTKTARAASR